MALKLLTRRERREIAMKMHPVDRMERMIFCINGDVSMRDCLAVNTPEDERVYAGLLLDKEEADRLGMTLGVSELRD